MTRVLFKIDLAEAPPYNRGGCMNFWIHYFFGGATLDLPLPDVHLPLTYFDCYNIADLLQMKWQLMIYRQSSRIEGH